MNIENVDKKLREAKFFLAKMIEQEGRAFGDKEPFDFYLSAFLTAAKTVDYRLRHEQKAMYPAWRETWDAKLRPEERCLIKFMVDDRNIEVHESGSGRAVKTESVQIGNVYSRSGFLEILAPPITLLPPRSYFTIAGTERKATDACGEYVELLDQMVTRFKADHPWLSE